MRTSLALALALILPLAAGCGDDDETPPSEEAAPEQPAVEAQDTTPPTPDTATAPEDPPEEPEPPTADLPEGTLYTVQVGAFVEAENSSRFSDRLEDAGLPAWTETARVEGRSFDRIRIGATPDLDEARGLASLMEERLDVDTWITTVGDRDRLPAGVLDATRGVLEGG